MDIIGFATDLEKAGLGSLLECVMMVDDLSAGSPPYGYWWLDGKKTVFMLLTISIVNRYSVS
jgi:hypothetical protein